MVYLYYTWSLVVCNFHTNRTKLGRLQHLGSLALGLVLVGFGFKVSAAPFHFAAPDAYAGANSPVAGVLATASKAMGMIGLIRVLLVIALPEADASADESAVWLYTLATLSVITMTWGNLAALAQPIQREC